MRHQTDMTAAGEYRQLGIRHEIETASPHRLIQLLMEKFLAKVSIAKEHMERGNIAEKGECISQAISIVDGLRASLNHDADARLSGNFDALYDYMGRRLVESNLKDDAEGLEVVAGLMREIKSAWDVIGDQVGESLPPEPV